MGRGYFRDKSGSRKVFAMPAHSLSIERKNGLETLRVLPQIDSERRRQEELYAYELYLEGIEAASKFDTEKVERSCNLIIRSHKNFNPQRYTIGQFPLDQYDGRPRIDIIRRLESRIINELKEDLGRFRDLFDEALRGFS